jgi:UPF0271 protein
MIERGAVSSLGGNLLPIDFHTLCLHGDDPRAAGRARAIRHALEAAGVRVAALAAWL